MFVFAHQQVLDQILETPCPFGGFFRLTADDIEIISPLARRRATGILAVPEIDDNVVRVFLYRYHISTLSLVVVVDDESRGAKFKIMNEPVLYGIVAKLTVLPAALL